MRRARIWAYLLWQARDFVLERGAPLVIVAGLMTSSIIVALRQLRVQAEGIQADAGAGLLIAELVAGFSLFAVIIGINGVVSNDRVRGYFRILFAKPLSVPRYYAQAWIVNGAGLLAVTCALCAAIYFFGYPLFAWRAILAVGLVYISLGGLGFFYSTIARFDWLLLAATLGLAHLLRTVFRVQGSAAGEVLDTVLPFHRLQELTIEIVRGRPVDSEVLSWMLGWGISGFVLGLVVLRRRPLAR